MDPGASSPKVAVYRYPTEPDAEILLPLILDTGATTSLLKEAVLLALGYDMAAVPITSR